MTLQKQVADVLKMDTCSDDDKVQRRIRWANVAMRAVETGPGNLVEIGALAGDTTVLLCQIAEAHHRNVMVIDPWIAPTHDVAGWEKAEFDKRTWKWREAGILYVMESTSQDPVAIHKLLCGDWAFALVDGSHKYQDVLCDAMSVRFARVICFDDMDRKDVKRAYDRALALLPGRIGIHDEAVGHKWEGYIV